MSKHHVASRSSGQPIHLILDPVSSHWSAEVMDWRNAHPRRTFVFHFLPVHASWLSFIEVWGGCSDLVTAYDADDERRCDPIGPPTR